MTTVRRNGRVVLMGGIREEVPLAYAWLMRNCVTLRGQWMYARESIGRLLALVRSGRLELHGAGVTRFPLERVNDAIAYAAANAGPFRTTVLCPV